MKHQAHAHTDGHKTVLLNETVNGLALKRGGTAIDATTGAGGHACAIASKLGKKGTLLVIDVDETALSDTKQRLAEADTKVLYVRGNFRDLKKIANEAGVTSADGIVFDLGWRAEQLTSGKGLSFSADEPLIMNLGDSASGLLTAKDIIADWDEDEIAQMIREYGEERFSGRIARAIVEARRKKDIATARALAEIIAASVPSFYRRGRIHPATRTFQALRIAVNDELETLKAGLSDALDLLVEGGRVAVISFHSLEDRIVKHAFREAEDAGVGYRVTKKPIVPNLKERGDNPRARSAKLRIFEKEDQK